MYSLLQSVTFLFFALNGFSGQQVANNINANENFKIIVNFDKTVVSGNYIITEVCNIQSDSIRKLLKQFNVLKVRAVFTNRYDEKGLLKPLQDKVYDQDSFGNWHQIIFKYDKCKATELVEMLKKEKGVLNTYIEVPLPFKPCVAPNDPNYSSQWHLNSTYYPAADIRAEQAWNINKGRSDVIIAVCDGGVDYTHPDLDPGDRSHVIAGYDYGDDDNDPMDDLPATDELSFAGHGTHVAGIIGAIANNNRYLVLCGIVK
jgi:subtilisin family serine protease